MFNQNFLLVQLSIEKKEWLLYAEDSNGNVWSTIIRYFKVPSASYFINLWVFFSLKLFQINLIFIYNHETN